VQAEREERPEARRSTGNGKSAKAHSVSIESPETRPCGLMISSHPVGCRLRLSFIHAW
jgi:hypothetical protein